MRSTWRPSEAELDQYARGPIRYEMEMLAMQTRALISRAPEQVAHNAFLEASIVHLRMLDDFLGDPRQADDETPAGGPIRDDVFARHWLPEWQPSRFLTAQQISDINAQVAHLAGRRVHWQFPWPILDLARECASKFEEFHVELETLRPDRVDSFFAARAYALTILA